ncbi:hypothetical protein CHARACLAT_030117, partial [Characodon lateralis]|nr:hypothetical protein [Characodon lateralis]
HLNIMAVYILSEGSGPGSQVPPHLTRILISLLSPGINCTNKTVKGKVIHKGPLVRVEADDFILKTVIKEPGLQILLPPRMNLQLNITTV